MAELVQVLTPIALLDSTSIIPLCIVVLVILLGGPSPLFRSTALLAGIFVTYLVCGLLVLFGLQSVFDTINAYALKVWQDPNTEELIFQILIGFILVVLGLRIARARKQQTEKKAPTAMTASQAFLAGAGMTIVGLPGAVPYLAAINLILRSDLTTRQEVMVLVVYNIVFVAPLAAVVVLSLVLGERSQRLLHNIRSFFDRWGQRLIVSLMLVLGALLIMDGVGWFLGTPLIPV
ncbi:MAG: GAP family protein [Alphaproteobacteria bacterium]|nr:GAP family protein [Alphaproteobacteria bacterium]